MPTLEWIGKSKVINHHQEVPFRVLERQYSYDEQGQHEEDNGSENMIIRGDNLEALKALLPRYEGRVKCIYIDPPYNTGNEGWVYNDNVNDPKIKKWLGEVVGKEGEDLTRHDKWLCMMYPRLKLLQKLLAEDGAIFISIDDTEYANLKLICDEIFGSNCFVSNMIWRSSDNSNNDAKQISNDHNSTLIYSKRPLWQPNKIFDSSKRSHFKNPDNDPRGPYFDGNPLNSPNPRENLRYSITSPQGITIEPPPNGWRWSKETLQEKMDSGEIFFTQDGTGIRRRTYLCDMEGLPPSSLCVDVSVTGSTRAAKYEQKKIFSELKASDVFSTPKPTALLQYILMISSSKDCLILDSFAGSGTTAHAVLNMNKADGGHRKFILVEMMDYADSITAERVKRVIHGYGEGKNAVEGTGGNFSFYDLGEPLLVGDCLNEAVAPEKIREYIWFMETKTPYTPLSSGNPYYLGKHNSTGYYFYYEPQRVTVLDYAFLSTITEKADGTVIYADRCSISEDKLAKMGVTFKKIPRDISRL